jgi:hypothetical protein
MVAAGDMVGNLPVVAFILVGSLMVAVYLCTSLNGGSCEKRPLACGLHFGVFLQILLQHRPTSIHPFCLCSWDLYLDQHSKLFFCFFLVYFEVDWVWFGDNPVSYTQISHDQARKEERSTQLPVILHLKEYENRQ